MPYNPLYGIIGTRKGCWFRGVVEVLRRGAAVAGVLAVAVAILRWLAAPVPPGGGAGGAAAAVGERIPGGAAREGFLLLRVEEVVLAEADAGLRGLDPSPAAAEDALLQPAEGETVRLPAGFRVRPGAAVVVYRALALDRPLLRRLVVLERLPAEVAGTRHLRRLARGGLRVAGAAEDGTVTLEMAGRRVDLAPGRGWGLGWAEGHGVRELPRDRWRASLEEARRRGEVVTALSVVNDGWWRVRVPAR